MLDLIQTIILYKFADISQEELQAMFELKDIKKATKLGRELLTAGGVSEKAAKNVPQNVTQNVTKNVIKGEGFGVSEKVAQNVIKNVVKGDEFAVSETVAKNVVKNVAKLFS